MSGFGLLPAGLGPFGFGVPPEAALPPDGPSGSRYINPATKDYEQDPDTLQLKQMPALRQRVLIAMTMRKGSAVTLPDLGVAFPTKMGTAFEAEVTASVRAALRQLTDIERVLRINAIAVERGASGRARVTLSYTDLTTGNTDQVTA